MSAGWGVDHPLFSAMIQLDQDLMSYPWTEKQWLETSDPSFIVFHWPTGLVPQGFALFKLSSLEKLAHLLKIALAPELRGLGVAQQFWELQIATLRTQGFERIYLEVATNNPAAAGFYRKIGFKMLREVKGFYKDGQSAWTMELAI